MKGTEFHLEILYDNNRFDPRLKAAWEKQSKSVEKCSQRGVGKPSDLFIKSGEAFIRDGSAIMKHGQSKQEREKSKVPTVLVAVDFSHCSRLALRRAQAWAESNNGKILVLHVIDQDFVKHCIHQHLGTEKEIKKKLFTHAKSKLREFLRREGLDTNLSQMIVCEGTPCMEINRKAVENDVEMIIMGSKGNSDDMKAIFFGSTTERVLRFIKRPVLCIPPACTYNLN